MVFQEPYLYNFSDLALLDTRNGTSLPEKCRFSKRGLNVHIRLYSPMQNNQS